jgi:DNA-binding MarR family transcriptional regulator
MVSAGFVDRGELTADRRQRVLTLTRKGQAFVERLMQRREQELAEIVARMSDPDRDALMVALTPFNEAASTDLYPVGQPGASRDPRLHEWGI